MDRDIDRYYEELAQRLMAEAESRFREGRYDETLRILEEVDRATPNRAEVVAFRRLCTEKKGMKQFRTLSAKDKERTTFDGSGTIWESGPAHGSSSTAAGATEMFSAPPTASAPIRGKDGSTMLANWEPGQFAHVEEPSLALDYGKRRTNSAYLIGIGAFFVFYFMFVLRPLLGAPAPGATREFAGIEFVWIPETSAGNETVGGFWMSKFELTTADYARTVDSASANASDRRDYPMTGLQPTEWLESYLDRINRLNVGTYRLPTTNEWLYAIRGGTTGAYAFGDDSKLLRDYGWYADNSENSLHPVGQKLASAWGLYDVHGNAAEWCLSPRRSAEDSIFGADESDAEWIAMGGSALDSAAKSALASRSAATEESERRFTGIRLVREPGRGGNNKLKLVEFPEDKSVGTLLSDGRRVGGGRAQGRVSVLEREPLTLRLSLEGLEHEAAFAALRPDDLHGLVITNLPADDSVLHKLARLTGLHMLDMSDTRITDNGLAQLARLDRLESLRLARTPLQGWGLDVLPRLPHLVELDLDGVSALTNDVVFHLKRCQHLARLSIAGTGITEEARKELQIALPKCWIRPEPPPPTPRDAYALARREGTYSMLVQQIRQESDYKRFGYVSDLGYRDEEDDSALGNVHAGYRIYVRPFWYVWGFARMNDIMLERLRTTAIDWDAIHAVGLPDEADLGAAREAWSPHPRDTDAWLSVEFNELTRPNRLRIFTKTDRLVLRRVTAFSLEGEELDVWNEGGEIPLKSEGRSFVGEVELDTNGTDLPPVGELFRIRLYVQPSSPNVWIAEPTIDAVQLVQDGVLEQWGHAAFASSTFNEVRDGDDASAGERLTEFRDPNTIGPRGVYGQLVDMFRGRAR